MAGGRAREPLVKDEAYSLFLETKFCWTGVDMLFKCGETPVAKVNASLLGRLADLLLVSN